MTDVEHLIENALCAYEDIFKNNLGITDQTKEFKKRNQDLIDATGISAENAIEMAQYVFLTYIPTTVDPAFIEKFLNANKKS